VKNPFHTWSRFINPVGQADDRPVESRPALLHSWAFAFLFGMVCLHGTTGFLGWFLDSAQTEFIQYATLKLHVAVSLVTILFFILLLKNHVRSLYGPWRARWLVAAYLGAFLLGVYIHMPVWQLFFGLPALLIVLLSPVLLKPRVQTEKAAPYLGILTATAWWCLLIYSAGWYFMHEEFYITYVQLHLGLICTTFALTGLHIALAGKKESTVGPSFKARATLIALMLFAAVPYIGTIASRTSSQFETKPGIDLSLLPAHYDTADVQVGRALEPNFEQFFVDSENCNAVGCHDDLYRQWSISSHRYAAVVTPYRKMLELVTAELGVEATMLCTKCHAPQLAMLGLPDDPNDPSLDRYRNEGINCQFCHSITGPSASRSNGELVLKVNRDHLHDKARTGDNAEELYRNFVHHNLSEHRKIYPIRDPSVEEYCIGCHRVVMPKEWVGDRKLILGDVHTPFANSKAAKEGISCSECHMPLATFWEDRFGRDKHARPDHRTLGTNNAMSLMLDERFPIEPDVAELDRATTALLDGTYTVPPWEVTYLRLIGNKKFEGYVQYLEGRPKMAVTIRTPERTQAGSTTKVAVTVWNQTSAHVMPSGPLDLNQYWLHVVVRGASGETLFETGAIMPDNYLQEGAVVFGGVPMDAEGKPVEKHRFWTIHSLADKRMIPVDGSYEHAFEVPIPEGASGALIVEAAFCYRRYTQKMADWIYEEDGTTFPIFRFEAKPAAFEVSPVAEVPVVPQSP
jgi:Cytochrome c554 and c-prime